MFGGECPTYYRNTQDKLPSALPYIAVMSVKQELWQKIYIMIFYACMD